MAEPLVVVIPHKLGQDEATRRIKAGLGRARTEFASLLTIENEVWDDNRLVFGARAMGQHAHGMIDIGEASVRLEVTLPWLLAKFAAAAQRVIGQKGTLMLEKK
jgi:putative polyhydroxyalkanoic acid system protein